MVVCFYKLHQNNSLYGENVFNEKYLCANIGSDWRWTGGKYLMTRWQDYQITDLNQEFKMSMEKQPVKMPTIYDS